MKNLVNSFTSYELTPEETLQGNVLNESQIRVLQNKLSAAAESKIDLIFDPAAPHVFAQDEAYLRGKIDLLKELLLEHDDAVEYFASLKQ